MKVRFHFSGKYGRGFYVYASDGGLWAFYTERPTRALLRALWPREDA